MITRATIPAFITSITAGAFALLAGTMAIAQNSVQDFQLPPAPDSGPANTNVQGPIDPDAPVARPPRAISTDTPPPSTPPANTQGQAGSTPQPAANTRATQAPRSRSQVTPAPRQREAAPQIRQPETSPSRPEPARTVPDPTVPGRLSPGAEPEQGDFSDPIAGNSPALPADSIAQSTSPVENQQDNLTSGDLFRLLAAGSVLLLVLAAGYFWWHRRKPVVDSYTPVSETSPEQPPVPDYEPLAKSPPTRIPPPSPASAIAQSSPTTSPAIVPHKTGPDTKSFATEPAITVETASLIRSLMNLKLTYRIILANPSAIALRHVRLDGGLITAHGNDSTQQSQASPDVSPLDLRHEIPELPAGETVTLSGEITLPLRDAQPVMQGHVPMLIPLLRWQGTAEGTAPFGRTFLLGRITETSGNRLQPFRLDHPPQSYPDLGLKALD
ncbi:MAG: hypothetical protein ACK5NN_03555 [Sphingomonadaceae bacterium]